MIAAYIYVTIYKIIRDSDTLLISLYVREKARVISFKITAIN